MFHHTIFIATIKLEEQNDDNSCRNLNLKVATKARACKGVSQEGSPRVTSHAPKSVGKCEELNLHTLK
jgi:hypothetical protein